MTSSKKSIFLRKKNNQQKSFGNQTYKIVSVNITYIFHKIIVSERYYILKVINEHYFPVQFNFSKRSGQYFPNKNTTLTKISKIALYLHFIRNLYLLLIYLLILIFISRCIIPLSLFSILLSLKSKKHHHHQKHHND